MIKYTFRDGPITIKAADKANAQVIGDTLAKIGKANDGKLTPKAVLEAARSKTSPLHKHFEWDDSVAAERYRLDQAREIIGIIRVVDAKAGERPAYISIASDEGTSYRTVQDVASSADLQMAILRQCDRDLEAITRRYRQLMDVCELTGKAREAIRVRIANLETRAAA